MPTCCVMSHGSTICASAGNAGPAGGLGPSVQIAVAGATGFVGRALVARLAGDGHEVLALSRSGSDLPGAAARAVDVGDEAALTEALAGCAVAYYLVHSLAAGDFRARDLRLGRVVRPRGGAAGVERIVYLGASGRTRRPSTWRAARRWVRRSAPRACRWSSCGPRWSSARGASPSRCCATSPSGCRSWCARVGCAPRSSRSRSPTWSTTSRASLGVAPGVYEIGGAEVTTYRDMIAAYARARGLPRRRIVDVPYLTPRLSSYWVDFVTPVDRNVSHALIESLVTEVVVRDAGPHRRGVRRSSRWGWSTRSRAALDDQADALDDDLLDAGRADCSTACTPSASVADCRRRSTRPRVDADLDRIGGDARLVRPRSGSGGCGSRWAG